MPDAARITDRHACPKVEPGPVPHVGGPIFTASKDVIVGFLPAARVKDLAQCTPVGQYAQINKGSRTVFINHRAAARVGDETDHHGVIVDGCPTVRIGDTPQSFAMHSAADHGTPFCEECERRKHEHEHEHGAPPEIPDDSVTANDIIPPPDAIPHKGDWTALAGQPNADDGLDEARRAAREKVAWDFHEHEFPKDSLHSIESELRGIDLDSPVGVVPVPPPGAGGTLYQWARKGATDFGNLFTLASGIPPSNLGINANAVPIIDGKAMPPAVPRVEYAVVFPPGNHGQGLLSTAAPTVGGSQQVMVPEKYRKNVLPLTIPE